ncbi:MAG: TIGR04086 family membrane protein [Oliverpabstia sp.]
MEQTIKSARKMNHLVKGLILAYLLTGLSLLFLAFLLYKMHLDEGKVTIGIILIYVISCFVGGLFVGKKAGERRFFWGMMLGLCYFLLLTAVSALTEPGITQGWRGIATSFVLCMGAGMLGGMIA